MSFCISRTRTPLGMVAYVFSLSDRFSHSISDRTIPIATSSSHCPYFIFKSLSLYRAHHYLSPCGLSICLSPSTCHSIHLYLVLALSPSFTFVYRSMCIGPSFYSPSIYIYLYIYKRQAGGWINSYWSRKEFNTLIKVKKHQVSPDTKRILMYLARCPATVVDALAAHYMKYRFVVVQIVRGAHRCRNLT